MPTSHGNHLVECYWPDVTEAKLTAATRRIHDATLAARTEGGDVAYLGAFLMPTDETVFCLFDGREADVRAVSVQAQLPLERVLAMCWLEPTDQPEDPEK
jgi:predicted amino acid dehydrogenase